MQRQTYLEEKVEIKDTESFKLVETMYSSFTMCYNTRDDHPKTMETPQVLAVFIQLADFCCIMVRQSLEVLEVWLTSGLGWSTWTELLPKTFEFHWIRMNHDETWWNYIYNPTSQRHCNQAYACDILQFWSWNVRDFDATRFLHLPGALERVPIIDG